MPEGRPSCMRSYSTTCAPASNAFSFTQDTRPRVRTQATSRLYSVLRKALKPVCLDTYADVCNTPACSCAVLCKHGNR